MEEGCCGFFSKHILSGGELQNWLSEISECFSIKGLKRYNLLITLWNDSSFTISISATSGPWDGHLLSSATSLIASCVWRKTHLSCYFQVKMRWGEKGYPGPHKTVQSFRVVWRTPAAVWYLKHSCVWSAWLGASAFCTRAWVVVLVQLWQPRSKFLLLYLHTEQTGNCVHLYANVFVPKAEILN